MGAKGLCKIHVGMYTVSEDQYRTLSKDHYGNEVYTFDREKTSLKL